ncbi:MAG: hypothetical protein IID45_14225 [Planctomycetes bacterium]|nr:hypothetical protein [Planctomycetota bacterium]
MGDFIIVDPSNPKNPLAIAVEAKTKAGAAHAGRQLKEAAGFMGNAGFNRLKTFTGTLAEFLHFIGAGQ